MKYASVLAASLASFGCAQVGTMPDSDFTWSESTINVSYQQAYRNIKDAADSCPSYVIDGAIYDDIREARISVYYRSLLGDRAPTVAGKVTIKDEQGRSHVTVGTTGINDGAGAFGLSEKGWARKRLIRWAGGDLRCRD